MILDKLQSVVGLLNSFGSGGSGVSEGESLATKGFHGFVNRINRLPRLLLLIGVMALLVWPVFDPDQFTAWTGAIKTIPEELWILIFLVVSSWVATKLVRDIRPGSPSYDRLSSSSSYGGYSDLGSGIYHQTASLGSFPEDDDYLNSPVDQGNSAIEEWRNAASKSA